MILFQLGLGDNSDDVADERYQYLAKCIQACKIINQCSTTRTEARSAEENNQNRLYANFLMSGDHLM